MDVTRHIAAPADAVWEQFARTSNWPAWGPTVRAVDPPDAQVRPGLRGTVTTAVGTAHVVEPDGEGCRVTIRIPAWAPFYAPVCHAALRRIAARTEQGRSDA